MGYFWATILKKLLSYLKSAPFKLGICTISRNNKNAYICDQKCHLGIFRLEFQKTNVMSEISPLELVSLQHFVKKHKCLTLGPNFGYFWTGIWQQYCRIWNQHSRTLKFREKTKMPNFETRNAWFVSFWPKMPYVGIFGVQF